MTPTVIVASLGQLIGSDYTKTTSALLEKMNENGVMFPKFRLHLTLIWDRVWTDTLAKFNRNEITAEHFSDYVRSSLGLGNLSHKEFIDIWNLMSTVRNENLDSMRKLIDLTNQPQNSNTYLAIISNTNTVHYDHILSQLKNAGIDFNTAKNTKFALSFLEETTYINALVDSALKKLGLQHELKHMVSFHHDIDPSEEEVSYMHTTSSGYYLPTTSSNFYANLLKQFAKEDEAQIEEGCSANPEDFNFCRGTALHLDINHPIQNEALAI